MAKYKIGDTFKLTSDAVDNYGIEYGDKVYTVRGVFTHYVKPDKMKDDPTGHPGFDPSGGGALYEADGLNFALYDWEMERA